jgi:hypothetical protein
MSSDRTDLELAADSELDPAALDPAWRVAAAFLLSCRSPHTRRGYARPPGAGPGLLEVGEESGLTSRTSVMVWHEAGHVVAYLVHGQSSARDDPGR